MADELEDDDAPEDVVLVDMPNAADEDGVQAQAKASRRRKEKDGEFLARLLADPAGRKFVWSVLAECHPFETKFGAGPVGFPDERATWTFLGEQLLGLRFYLSWQRLDPAGMQRVLDEFDPRFAKPKRIRKQE